MDKNKTIELYAKEIKTEKNKFIACSAVINGKYTKIKFTRKCNGVPATQGMYHLTVNLGDCSVSQDTYEKDGEIKTTPILWVDYVQHIEKFTEEELKARDEAKLKELFGD